jgi:hypothetical protein
VYSSPHLQVTQNKGRIQMTKTIGLLLLLVGVTGLAFGGTVVPEIDPGAGVSALAVLSGAMLVIRGRKR